MGVRLESDPASGTPREAIVDMRLDYAMEEACLGLRDGRILLAGQSDFASSRAVALAAEIPDGDLSTEIPDAEIPKFAFLL